MKLFILLLCTTAMLGAPSTSFTEEDAKQFILDSSGDFFEFFNTLSRTTFAANEKGDFVQILYMLNILEGAAHNLTTMAKQAQNYPYETFQDEKVKLGIRNLRTSAYLYVLGDEYFKKMLISTKYLKELGTDADICKFQDTDTDDCDLAYMPNIHKIISQSDDEAELKYYWEAWRERNNKFGSTNLQTFVDLFKKAADLTGTKPLDLWYRIYMDSNFLTEMEKVLKEIEPFYKKLHSYIRFHLNEKYGDKIVLKNGPIPYHLFDKVLVQNWIKNVVEPPYPDYQFPDLDTRVKNMVGKNNKTLMYIADDFCESMDIDDAAEGYLEDGEKVEDHVKNLDEKSGDNDCKPEMFTQSTYYYLKMCPQITFRKYLQAHGWIIPVYFVQQKKTLAYGHFQSYNFEVPSGEAVILSASSPKHLAAVGLLTEEEIKDVQLPMNRLFKMSIHTMLNIPMYFVHSKVMNDLLSGKVTVENVNEYYWKLMKQYAGVAPPLERTKDSLDFSYKFYEDLENNHQTTKFVSEIVGYQIYSSLCKSSGIEQGPLLSNCDFYKSKKAGEKLKEFMKIGSTKTWRDALSVITGDASGLSGKAILEYYEPLGDWLNKNIDGKKIPVGW